VRSPGPDPELARLATGTARLRQQSIGIHGENDRRRSRRCERTAAWNAKAFHGPTSPAQDVQVGPFSQRRVSNGNAQ
jgi:hypothetical protein